jgi:hypothetical protein
MSDIFSLLSLEDKYFFLVFLESEKDKPIHCQSPILFYGTPENENRFKEIVIDY